MYFSTAHRKQDCPTKTKQNYWMSMLLLGIYQKEMMSLCKGRLHSYTNSHNMCKHQDMVHTKGNGKSCHFQENTQTLIITLCKVSQIQKYQASYAFSHPWKQTNASQISGWLLGRWRQPNSGGKKKDKSWKSSVDTIKEQYKRVWIFHNVIDECE